MATYYDILGVEKNASDESIKRAFRSKAKLVHPDINSSPVAKARFQQINEAYQVLRDENKRRSYDLRLNYGYSLNKVYYQNGHPPGSRPHHNGHYKHQKEEEPQSQFEKIFDQFLYLFMLSVGLFALVFGIARIWSEPIEGVNPVLGIIFGSLLTGLLVWGWHTRNKKPE